ncbi:MAG: outer membrane beta-barrel protein [Prevotella sp.]|nr:outer membrane beta-barrel protein [Prevotella sp.]
MNKVKMKKTLLLSVFMLLAVGARAQKKWTFTPQVGINVCDMQGSDALECYKMVVEPIAGVEAEYRPTKLFGISLGGFYSVKGCNPNFTFVMREGSKEKHSLDYSEYISRYEVRYLSFPLMLNFHVWKGLTAKCGFQYSNLITARNKGYVTGYADINDQMGSVIAEFYILDPYYSTSGIYYGHTAPAPSSEKMSNPVSLDHDFNNGAKAEYHRMELAIPLGLSYEYKNVVLDVRYQIGLSKLPRIDRNDRVYNSCTSITLGYKL